MTGLELLKQEMLNRGATKAQTESKLVAIVLDILANTGTTYTDLAEAHFDLENTKALKENTEREIVALQAEIQNMKARKSIEYRILRSEQEALEQKKAEAERYIEAFNAALENMETEEARDRLRTAQVFMNSVKIDTCYDNTAFINWFGAILAGEKTGGIEAFRKLEPESIRRHGQMKAGPRI